MSFSPQAVFQITPLNVEEWIAVLKLSFPVIIIDEVLKLIARKFTDGTLLLIIRQFIVNHWNIVKRVKYDNANSKTPEMHWYLTLLNK